MATLTRDYSFADADLMMFASNLSNTLMRDIDEFEQFNVDIDAINAFKELGDQFEVFPPDTYYLSDIGIANSNKEAIRANLLHESRRISNRALIKWGANSSQYNKFGVKNMTKMTDKELLATSRLVKMTAYDYLSDLSSEGLTQQIIDDYELLAQSFEDSMNSINTAMQIREQKTNERITLGNQLYALVTKYCILGKTIWEQTNESKYNDYVIYTPGPGTITAPVNLLYYELAKQIAWDEVVNATSYECVYMLANSTEEWIILYSGANNYADFAGEAGTYIAKVRARNAGGFGKWSEDLNFMVINP